MKVLKTILTASTAILMGLISVQLPAKAQSHYFYNVSGNGMEQIRQLNPLLIAATTRNGSNSFSTTRVTWERQELGLIISGCLNYSDSDEVLVRCINENDSAVVVWDKINDVFFVEPTNWGFCEDLSNPIICDI